MKNSKKYKKDISNLHKEKLGMDIPEDFFAKSRENIISKVIKEEKPKQTIFYLSPLVAYPLAASIILAIALTIYMKNSNTENTKQITNTEDVKLLNTDMNDEDFIISSLMISDSDMGTYLNNYLVNNVVIESQLQEQKLEDIFINSILIEDSLINNYLDKSLIENIVL